MIVTVNVLSVVALPCKTPGKDNKKSSEFIVLCNTKAADFIPNHKMPQIKWGAQVEDWKTKAEIIPIF